MNEMNFEKWQHYWRASVFQFFNKEDQAIQEYRLALLSAPDFARAPERAAFIYATRGDFKSAAASFRDVLAIEPDNAVIHFNLGFACDKTGDVHEAITAFQNATRLNAQLDRAWYGLGICHAKLGNHAEAAQALHEAATLQPMNPHAWYALGMANHHLNKPDRVTDVIMHLHRFDPIMTRQLIHETNRSDLAHLVADLLV
jgi:tetratricopeptide (TPR) repeat protein